MTSLAVTVECYESLRDYFEGPTCQCFGKRSRVVLSRVSCQPLNQQSKMNVYVVIYDSFIPTRVYHIIDYSYCN